MDTATKDWLVVGCSIASVCASLSVPIVSNFLSTLRRNADNGRILRQEFYAAILCSAARANERFLSAAIRQKLLRLRPDNVELSVHVDEDIGAGWIALEELGKKLQADQLICSDKVLALVSDANSKHFWRAESLFRLYGHTALDIDDLHKQAQDLVAKLKHRCRREIGLGAQR
jgi:hypothetical protein